MISKDPSGSRYKLWQFNCVAEGGRSRHTENDPKIVWRIVNFERTMVDELLEMYRDADRRRSSLKSHLHGGELQNIKNSHWLLSKTGEVNLTEFKQDKKAAIAKFLAKSVEGGEVVEIRDVSSTSVMINSCYDMPKTRHGLGAYACLGLGSNLIRVSSGELIAKPAYTQSPVDIKLSCAPPEVYAQACSNVCVAMLIILHR